MKQITLFETRDGKQFATADEAKGHEAEHPEYALVGLIAEDIEDALAGRAPDIAEALEKIGARVARERRESGNLKRVRKGSAAAPETAPTPAGDAAPSVVDDEPYTEAEQAAFQRGAAAFAAGQPGDVPADLQGTTEQDAYLDGYDEAQTAAPRRVA